MDVLITYDIKGNLEDPKNAKVKEEMISTFKYLQVLDHEDITYTLPNTTLWKKDTEPEQAMDHLLTAAKMHKAKVIRCIAVEFTNRWIALEGESYSSLK